MSFLLPILTCITPKRIANTCKMYVNFLISNLFHKVFVCHLPAFVSVEPANFCMLRCPECVVGIAQQSKPRQRMEMSLFSKIVSELSPFVHTMIFYFQGEPLLNEELPTMIATAKSKKLYTITSTNAQKLDNELAQRLVLAGLDRIIISIDGITQESYGQYRVGGNLQKAIAGVGFLHYWKKVLHKSTPLIEVQCLQLKSNEREWKQLAQVYKSWGADRLVFKTAQFYTFEHGNKLMPSNEKYSRYQQKNGKWTPKWQLHNRCLRLWSGVVVDSGGNVLPCCFDKLSQYAFGNLYKQSFRDIWFGKKANAFREQILKQRKALEMCRNCTSR